MPKTPKTKPAAQGLAEVRARIAALKAERYTIETAPLPRSEVADRLIADLKQTAAELNTAAVGDAIHGFADGHPLSTRSLAFMFALDRERVEKFVRDVVDREERAEGLPSEERARALAKLDHEIFSLECIEIGDLLDLEARGDSPTWRADADPLAFLTTAGGEGAAGALEARDQDRRAPLGAQVQTRWREALDHLRDRAAEAIAITRDANERRRDAIERRDIAERKILEEDRARPIANRAAEVNSNGRVVRLVGQLATHNLEHEWHAACRAVERLTQRATELNQISAPINTFLRAVEEVAKERRLLAPPPRNESEVVPLVAKQHAPAPRTLPGWKDFPGDGAA